MSKKQKRAKRGNISSSARCAIFHEVDPGSVDPGDDISPQKHFAY